MKSRGDDLMTTHFAEHERVLAFEDDGGGEPPATLLAIVRLLREGSLSDDVESEGR